MDPEEGTWWGRFPFRERLAMNEPRPRPCVVRFPGNMVILPWIWRREPTANILLQLVTCHIINVISGGNGSVTGRLTFQFVHVARHFM